MSTRTRRLVTVTLLLLSTAAAPTAHAAFGDISLVGQLTLPNTVRITDVWAYSDPINDKEYAIVGDWSTGVYIVDVTTPSSPTYVTKVLGVPGFDVKVWDHYVYTCDGNNTGIDSRIIDIGNVNAPLVLPTKFLSAHNIAISKQGVMFLEYLGLTTYDVATDPEHPDSLWHGTSDGHDATPRGDMLFDFTGYDKSCKVWNMINPASPVLMGSIIDPTLNYSHSGDASSDGNYLYLCDELANTPEPDIIVYNISNLASPVRGVGLDEPSATTHNLYVIGDLAFVSYYTAGFRTLDLTNPATPVVADTYDTYAGTGEGYNGAFGVYPYNASGLIYISDHPNGLFIFSVEGYNGPPTAASQGPRAAGASLGQNFPNPFNPTTTIDYRLGRPGAVRIEVFDVGGRLVRTLVDGDQAAGPHRTEWNGTNDAGASVASGVYYYRLTAGGADLTRKMVLLK